MKIKSSNHVELSVSNLRALVADIDKREREGRTVSSYLHKVDASGQTVCVSVVADADHYTDIELADRGDDWKGAANV